MVRIGSVLFNVNTKRIVGLVERDSVALETSYEVDVVSRWISPDPMSEMRTWLSPYNFVQNNPLNRIDPDGRLDEWAYNYETKELTWLSDLGGR
ncbi:RHS repeat-associated core domain-containing protein [Indibacter alkaliphilus]|uniref:RHS repeat-associated core domain-containing protein n=1 Tax=Indibacter alkaliphilus TaxID=579922 RepID=UPI0029352283|nr:RHS repeat-associated core domain-containing protein [Indibacter alkaliphilus]